MDIGPNFFGSYFSSSTEVLFQMNLLVKQTFDETLYNHGNPGNSFEKYHFAIIKQNWVKINYQVPNTLFKNDACLFPALHWIQPYAVCISF